MATCVALLIMLLSGVSSLGEDAPTCTLGSSKGCAETDVESTEAVKTDALLQKTKDIKILGAGDKNYVVGNYGSNSCSPNRAITENDCRAAAESLGATYVRTGSWSDDPTGCEIDEDKKKVWFNTNQANAKDDKYAPVCDSSSTTTTTTTTTRYKKYVINGGSTNSCPNDNEAITENECRAAAGSLGATYVRTGSWGDQPTGCEIQIDALDKVWFNTNQANAWHDNYATVCGLYDFDCPYWWSQVTKGRPIDDYCWYCDQSGETWQCKGYWRNFLYY